MSLVTCVRCGSDDVERDPAAPASDLIAVRCVSRGHTFSREPDVSCTRCHSRNVASREYEGWAYDDIEEARENPDGGTWAYYDREEFRCMDCNYTWRKSGQARPFNG
jgi:hypothetical protein